MGWGPFDEHVVADGARHAHRRVDGLSHMHVVIPARPDRKNPLMYYEISREYVRNQGGDKGGSITYGEYALD